MGCALAFGLGLLATPSRAATVIGNLTDISLEPLDTKLVFAPVTDVLVNAAGLDAGPPKVVTSTGGAFSVVLDAGDYTVSLPLVAWRKPFAISVFATNGTVNLTNLLAAPQTYTHTNNLNYTVRATPLDAAPDVLAAKLETAGGLAKLTNIAGGAATLVLSNTPPERLAPVAQTVGAAGQWFWLGSVGANRFGGGPFSTEYITLAQSGDGLSWTQLVNGPVYFEPNYYTNQNGPIAREGAIQFAEGQFWLVYNFDPYDAGGLAQGLGLACSTDLTNWSRAAVLYPFGTTNSDGVMFAATWFTDGDGSNYLVGAYGRGAVTSPKDCFVIRRLDGTFTNWSAPVTLLPHTIFKWDGALVKTGARYDLYYVNLLGGVSRATNDNLTTEFHPDYDLDSLSYGLEAPQLVALEGTGLRMYGRLAGDMYYAESTNHGDTWPPDPTLLSGLPCWHGPGILRLDQPATNLVCALGAERGLVRIDAPVLRANQFLAQDARVENGLVANDGYFLNHLRSTNLTADWLSLGFTNPPPANPGTVKAWVQISVGGQTFKVPLYQ